MYLETERLILRRMEESDLPDVMKYVSDPERCRMMGTLCPQSPAQAGEAFQWMLAHEKRFYAIVLKSENRCVGHLIVSNFPDLEDLPELRGLEGRSLTFCISRPYRRMGYASEAVNATVEYLFGRRGVDYVNSGYLTFNEPSMRLHEKLGFVPVVKTAVVLPDGGTATAVETVIMSPALRAKHVCSVSEK